MVTLILNGCHGKMGQAIQRVVALHNDYFSIVAGFDIRNDIATSFPVYTDPEDFTGNADVIIDFSHPSALTSILEYAINKNIPVVIATTGLSKDQISQIHQTAETLPVFYSANMSIGVNLIVDLAKKAAAILYGNFDIEIVEKHHNQKIDAPSGTALMIANAINSSLPQEQEYIYDRHSVHQKRTQNEIGIHSIRGGTIVGEHDVIFAGNDEIIEIKHTATSKEVFATGAVKAAAFLCGKEAGIYNMNDLVNS